MKFLNSLDSIWLTHLRRILSSGVKVFPRGIECLEVPHHTFQCHMWDSVLSVSERKLNYKFMAGEAYWILSGDNTVDGIAPYNPNISKFSDDGVTFFGAYGPKIMGQIEYVVEKLASDVNTRQATLTIWRENPPETKDVPCTVAMTFQIRGGLLNCHTFMRSSDVWLGLPYDVFNFSMVSAYILARLTELGKYTELQLGELYVTAVSSHLYESNRAAARDLLIQVYENEPKRGFHYFPEASLSSTKSLMNLLDILRHSSPGHHARWWERGR